MGNDFFTVLILAFPYANRHKLLENCAGKHGSRKFMVYYFPVALGTGALMYSGLFPSWLVLGMLAMIIAIMVIFFFLRKLHCHSCRPRKCP